MKHLSADLQACIDECLRCYQTCLGTAMGYCLEQGGRHVAPEHFRLMMACAEICRAAAHVMLTGNDLHRRSCAACADICEALRRGLRAARRHGGMRDRLPALRRILPQNVDLR